MGDPVDRQEIDRLSSRDPGADEENPYADVDIETLPEWWRRAIEEHRAYDLRPYRPPRFTDGEIYPSLKQELEEDAGVSVQLICYDMEENVWDVLVDGEKIGEVERVRSPEGYSIIGVESDAFRELVESA